MTNETETPELLPCPFCGSSEVNPEGWYRMTEHVFGPDCVVLGPACDECGSSAKTIDAWNTRADLADKRIEELEAQLTAMTVERDRLEQRYQREVLGLNNEGDPIGGHPPIGLKARAEAAEAKNSVVEALMAELEAKLARVTAIANLIAGRMMK